MSFGAAHPLGATVLSDGSVNFAVASEHGTRAFVCLFDPTAPYLEQARIELPRHDGPVFHGAVANVAPGTLYGFRVDGPFSPRDGHRFNVNKLLVDPYARAIFGSLEWDGPVFGFPVDHPEEDLAFDLHDSARFVPKAVVLAPEPFDWGTARPPRTKWSDTVIYELHVKGFTKLHPDVPPDVRGTYAGLGHEASIRHLKRLGVTAVELLPVHHAVSERHLHQRGLSNYWGYNTLGFFALDPRLGAAKTAAGLIREWKQMVKALHEAGLEVILDVVYNHTAEGDHLGPTLSLRGLDNRSYYQLDPDEPRRYANYTGCGNSVAVSSSPLALKLVMDSLRHWVTEMGVDGFRFDLATTLGRCGRRHAFARDAAFFQALNQDPVLCQAKLIAEPWDIFSPDSYQFAHFPHAFSEWNGEFRDNVRRFFRGDGGQTRAIAAALSGSADRFASPRRSARASVNFVTCHDGFTLADLVSYERKHNEGNGEDNRDGWDDNLSVNFGVEGPTTDGAVLAARQRQTRALLAATLLARGIPMLLAGDERGRTQRGNNNAYCQDNDLSWVDWTPTPTADALIEYVQALVYLRTQTPALAAPPVGWIGPDGAAMTDAEWDRHDRHALGLRTSDSLGHVLLLLNGSAADVTFRLPTDRPFRGHFDSARFPSVPPVADTYPLLGRSVVLLRST